MITTRNQHRIADALIADDNEFDFFATIGRQTFSDHHRPLFLDRILPSADQLAREYHSEIIPGR